MDVDVERQTPRGDREIVLDKIAKVARYTAGCILCLIPVTVIACILVLALYYMPDEHYSVAIDSASVLDHRAGLSFNLTLGVSSRSNRAKACLDPTMYVEVFYHGVQVAGTDAVGTRRTCARPRNMAGLPIMARATMMPVGAVLDSLAAEMGQGAAVFDLKLYVLNVGKSGKASCVWDCKGSRVGDAAVPCDSPKYTY